MPLQTYRKRVVEAKALQFTGENFDDVYSVAHEYGGNVEVLEAEEAYTAPDGSWGQSAQPRRLRVWSEEGGRILTEGSWLLISIPENKLYVRTDEEFQKAYEPVL